MKNGPPPRRRATTLLRPPPVSSSTSSSRETETGTPWRRARSAQNSATRCAWWWALTTKAVAPAAFRRTTTRSSMGTPATGSRALGVLRVSAPRREPTPAARTKAFMGSSRGPALALAVGHDRRDALVAQMLGEPLGEVRRAVLAARAAEGDEEMGEVAPAVVLDRLVDERERGADPALDRGLLGEVGDHVRVQSRGARELGLAPRV